jgi:ABC-2 type transport system ATP-binding protein
MAQKVQFIAAVVSRPKLLVLDEPFSGLDPVNGEALRDAVLALRREGTTVVFSTHDMGAAETLRPHLHDLQGPQGLDGSLDSIQQNLARYRARRLGGGAAALSGIAGIEAVNDHGNVQDVRFAGDPQALLRALIERTPVQQFEIAKPSLTTSSCASQTDRRRPARRERWRDAAHSDGRRNGIPAARSHQGVHHRHPHRSRLDGGVHFRS